jgi:hypothetical protein
MESSQGYIGTYPLHLQLQEARLAHTNLKIKILTWSITFMLMSSPTVTTALMSQVNQPPFYGRHRRMHHEDTEGHRWYSTRPSSGACEEAVRASCVRVTQLEIPQRW